MIRGTNLGGWFALERWMTPALFEGISAHDEREFYQELGFEAAKERLIHHWETFVTEEDFMQIAAWHLDAVRLPVPYTVFGDVEGRVGCLPYVDKAFTWAEKYGVKILLDLHTVPGNANGLENGGICGLCTWHLHPENVEKTNALKHSQSRYNRSRGVEKTSVHLLRHSFVKNWCMSGGNVFKLQKVLGHSTLTMTQHYANLYSNDLREGFDNYAALDPECECACRNAR